jgi:hypothetical protein
MPAPLNLIQVFVELVLNVLMEGSLFSMCKGRSGKGGSLFTMFKVDYEQHTWDMRGRTNALHNLKDAVLIYEERVEDARESSVDTVGRLAEVTSKNDMMQFEKRLGVRLRSMASAFGEQER